ncbi:hypothetical protein JRQ81_014849 [Phrynocephalus forsythii]|uniref:FYN-binding protein 2 n=1 Tax=Phrynocephalus forsythii TaxID=171643 RepID=A0A9Q1B3W4_9SAUR|nr:hypothetical protein JRQ81_014849 [Phrynocephalus forsythii]
MNMERAEDFRTLRAKFQNEAKKLPEEINPRQRLGASTTPSSKSKTFDQILPPEVISRQGLHSKAAPRAKPRALHLSQAPGPEQKASSLSLTAAELQLSRPSQTSETAPVKPVVLPRVKLRESSETGKNPEKKVAGSPGTQWKGAAPAFHSQKQRPASCAYPQEAGLADNTFHSTLHIWESAATLQRDQTSSTTPPQRPDRTTSLAQLSTSGNNAIAVEEKRKIPENVQTLLLAAPQKPPPVDLAPFPTVSPPLPPRSPVGSEKLAPGDLKTANSSPSTNKTGGPSKTLQYLNEGQNNAEEINFPKPKPLPSITSLGPPPKKPARPPKVDLTPFRRNLLGKAFCFWVLPEYLNCSVVRKKLDNVLTFSLCMNSGKLSSRMNDLNKIHRSKLTNKEVYAVPVCHHRKRGYKRRGPLGNPEMPKQAKEIVKISSHDGSLTKQKINGEYRGEKYLLQEETTSSFPGEGVAKDGNYTDIHIHKMKPELVLENRSFVVLKSTDYPWYLFQTNHQSYDFQELQCMLLEGNDGLMGEAQIQLCYAAFVADDAYEETYEDIQNEGYGSSKIEDVKVDKLKGFGKLFKKGKFKLKNTPVKDSARHLSRSAPNLDTIAKEAIVYNNVSSEQMDINSPSRTLFRVKKYNLEKNNKMTKEEKLFREKFMYEKEIKVINTAVAHCSNSLTKGKLDLKITAGEQLEVIDVTEGNQLLCRNSEGKYGYVLLEHLNFR